MKTLEAVKDEMAAFSADIDTSVNTNDVSIHEAEEPPAKKPKGLAAVLARCHSTSSDCVLTQTEKIQQEISQYCSHPKLAINESPLLWWKVEHARFPNLAPLARKYLCVCATSMPPERVFSCSGHIVSGKRSML